jgi:hypothetical protein
VSGKKREANEKERRKGRLKRKRSLLLVSDRVREVLRATELAYVDRFLSLFCVLQFCITVIEVFYILILIIISFISFFFVMGFVLATY